MVKRLFDVVFAGVALAAAAPLLALAALGIRLTSPGPVFYRSVRVGRHGRLFHMYKLRTMHAENGGSRSAITARDDPRVFPFGNWLRRSKLDELPQLVNVLRGEMSLVGPRPHAPGTTVEGRLFHEAVRRYAARHRVKPGITGWAQVNGWRGETDVTAKLEERLRHDLYYIDHWTLWLDITILARTLLVPFRHRNAY
jgi:lipopolysaccharide/colanic/teichoic acid biosynthesis glycosyltransferase